MKILNKNTLHGRVFFLFCIFFFSVVEVMAADSKLHVSDAACGIQYASQKIAKSYFYKELDIRYETAVQHIKQGQKEFDENLPLLQENLRDKEQENIMKFVLSSYEQLKAILPKPYSDENGAIILDASESIFEAAGFLAEAHLPEHRNGEEIMLGDIQRQLRLLERINKYYIAHHAGIKDESSVTQLKQSVADFETGLQKINDHEKHTEALAKSVERIDKLWPIAKDFYLGLQQREQPVIVLAATDKLTEDLGLLEQYHKKMVLENGKK